MTTERDELEPKALVHDDLTLWTETAAYSQAISLKRIADALENTNDTLNEILVELRKP